MLMICWDFRHSSKHCNRPYFAEVSFESVMKNFMMDSTFRKFSVENMVN